MAEIWKSLDDPIYTTMLYSRYKKHYADCKTVPGSYNKVDRTIDVFVPDGRMKPSGMRGQTLYMFEVYGVDKNGFTQVAVLRATCLENAVKQIKTRLVTSIAWDKERLMKDFAYLKRERIEQNSRAAKA